MTAIFNSIMQWFEQLAAVAIAILPDSPFNTLTHTAGFIGFEIIMSNINYFVPIGTFLSIGSAYTAAVLIYYAVRFVLRWTKFIE
jgi:hypothetical protein